jgi:sec-independent protein translocase protein TatA
MFGIGMPELVIIMVIALIVLGPQKLPELARSLGKGLAEFKRASSDFRRSMDEEARTAEEKERMAAEAAAKEAVEPEKAHEAAAIVTPVQKAI